jgi:drug/metabolite transporter (DMT)-like permease
MAATARESIAPDQTSPSGSGVWLTEVMLLAMAFIWGVNYTVVKYGTRIVPSLGYNALRIALASIVFLVIAAFYGSTRPPRRESLALVGLGVLGHGVYQVFFILGLARSRAGTVALVMAGGPAFVAIIGRMLRTEMVTRRQWFGIALQVAGIAFVVFNASAATSRGDTPLGMALILCGSLAWALFSVLVKPYTNRVSTLHVGALTVVGGALLVTTVGIPDLIRLDWSSVPLAVWIAVIYSGIGALVIANLFWYRGVRMLGPTHVAMFVNLQPAIALTVAWFALGEVPTVWQVLGATSIMGGLVISRNPVVST